MSLWDDLRDRIDTASTLPGLARLIFRVEPTGIERPRRWPVPDPMRYCGRDFSAAGF